MQSEKTRSGACTSPMVVWLHDTNGHKICHHILVKLSGQRGTGIAALKRTLYKSVNCPGDDGIEPRGVNLCSCSAEVASIVPSGHSFMCSGSMVAPATAATCKEEPSQLGEPHMDDGGGFCCIASNCALVKGRHSYACQSSEESDFPVAPNARWVFAFGPKWKLWVFQKAGPTGVGKTQKGLGEETDQPGAHNALLPRPLL